MRHIFQPRGEKTAFVFRLAVPKDLWGHIHSEHTGKPLSHIVVGLATDSPTEAQSKAAVLRHKWEQAFERARRGSPLSAEEIEDAAREHYNAMKATLARVPPTGEAIEAAIWQVEQDLTEDNWEAASPAIRPIEARIGQKIEPYSPVHRALAEALLNAEREAFYGCDRRLRGEPSIEPAAFTSAGIDPQTLQPVGFRRPQITLRDGPGFTEISERFLADIDRKSSKGRTTSTKRRYMTTFRLFADYSHDAPLVAVDRKMASGFLDTIAKLDPRWGQNHKAKGLPLSELLKRFGRGPGQLSNAALNHHGSALKSLFDWARKRGDFEKDNPFALQSRETADGGWVPYEPGELKTLLGSINGTLRNVTLTALYSGMRLEEITGLQREDIKREAGVLYFDLHEGRRLKTKAAVRRVPVHSALIEAGIIKAGGKGPLWPSLKASGPDGKMSVYLSKRFTHFRRKAGIDRDRLSFHSLRKNFVTALNQAGVHQADIAAVVGHAQGFTLDTYSGGPGLKRLRDVVEKVRYTGLKV